jgi:hypothetical protein
MKKFTFLIALTGAVLLSTAQNTETLQKKMEMAGEKYSRVTKSNLLLHNQSGFQTKNVLPSENGLKSTAASMSLDSIVSTTWDSESGGWKNDTKDEYFYDSEMKNTMWQNSDWNTGSNTWDIWSKTEVEYNENGSVDKMYIYESYEPGTAPTLMNTVNAFYNEAGRLDSVQHWYADGPDTWVLEGKQFYYYDDSKRLTEMKMWSLEDDEGEENMAVMRFVFNYTTAGRMETSSMFFLFEEEEMLFFKTYYNYDGSDRLVFTEDWSLDLMSFELEKNSRTDFEYNASGDVSTETFSSWDAAGEVWTPEETDEYTYHDFSNSEVFFPSYLMYFGIVEEMPVSGKAVAEIETMEWLEGTSQRSAKSIFYYSGGINTFADKPNVNGFSVFPNPATEHVTFRWSENHPTLSIEIYQITGSRILEKQISSGTPVSLSGMDNGIYLFKLNKGNQTLYSGKLIKK